MDKKVLNKIRRYIRFYNIIKTDKTKAKFKHDKETGVMYGISETESEVLFTFVNDKSSINFIRNYTEYRKKIESNDEREASEISFNEIVKHIPNDKFMMYCRQKTLDNPYRDYEIRNFLHSPLKQDRMCYLDFFAHKIKFYLHSGLYTLFTSISDMLIKDFEKYLNNTDKKIIIIGYSFASVIARLAYLTYFLKFPTLLNRVECYVYSTPNFGNKFFEKFYESLHRKEKYRRLFIINCDNDCVYNMMSKRFGFRHMKSTLLIKRNSETRHLYTSKDYEEIISYLNKN